MKTILVTLLLVLGSALTAAGWAASARGWTALMPNLTPKLVALMTQHYYIFGALGMVFLVTAVAVGTAYH